IKGRVNYDTLKALTVRPYALKVLTPVQERVTALLPDLVRPWDPEGIVPRKVPNPLPPNWVPPVIDPNAPRDLLVQSKPGTGKTFAYLIAAIDSRLNYIDHIARLAVINSGLTASPHIAGRARHAFRRASAGPLILVPTRDLAVQIAHEAQNLTMHQKDFEVVLLLGGTAKSNQMSHWMRFRRDLVIATPGRLRELLETESEVRKGLKDCPLVILDEADTLLSMGFRDDLDAILSFLPKPPVRQTFIFSATLSRSIRQLASSTFSQNHAFIDASIPEGVPMTHEHVPKFHTLCPTASDQLPTLLKLLAHDQLIHGERSKVILFCPTVAVTALFGTLLRALREPLLRNTRMLTLHSEMEPAEKSRASLSFKREGTSDNIRRPAVLVTSDVNTRGMDYPGVTRVIHLGIPSKEDVYVRRIGTMAREEGPGVRADLVLLPWEAGYLTWQLTNLSIKPFPISLLDKELASLSLDPSKLTSESLKSAVADLRGLVDGHSVRQGAASLLGYYLPLTPSLRLQPTSILSGIFSWVVACFGITVPEITRFPSRFMQAHNVHRDLIGAKGLFVDGVRIAGQNPTAHLKRGKGGSIKRAIWEGRGKRSSLTKATFTETGSFVESRDAKRPMAKRPMAKRPMAKRPMAKRPMAKSTKAERPQVENKKPERQEKTREVPERASPPHMRL
ncbi:P-loop containing nucleoside triphosphate hydrolase protein, partial [Melanogaster broomeanus]